MQSPQETILAEFLKDSLQFGNSFKVLLNCQYQRHVKHVSNRHKTTSIQSSIEQSLDIMYEKIIRKAYKGMVKN